MYCQLHLIKEKALFIYILNPCNREISLKGTYFNHKSKFFSDIAHLSASIYVKNAENKIFVAQ